VKKKSPLFNLYSNARCVFGQNGRGLSAVTLRAFVGGVAGRRIYVMWVCPIWRRECSTTHSAWVRLHNKESNL